MGYLNTQQNILLCVSTAVCTLFTILHILWYLRTLFTIHTSWVLCFTAHAILLTQMCDALNNWLRQPSCFLVSSPLDISDSPLHSFLVLVDLEVHMSLVRLSKYSETLSSAWSACPRSLRAFSVFCLISTLFAPNYWLTASTSLRLLPCQFTLLLYLATFLQYCFWAFFVVSRCQMPLNWFFLIFWVLSVLVDAFGTNLSLHLLQLDPVSQPWLSSPWSFCQLSPVIFLWLASPWSFSHLSPVTSPTKKHLLFAMSSRATRLGILHASIHPLHPLKFILNFNLLMMSLAA